MRQLCFLYLAIVGLTLHAQNAQTEINEQVWKPFIQSFSAFDTEAFMALHSRLVVRLDLESGKKSNYLEYYNNQKSEDSYNLTNKRQRGINFRFEHRSAKDSFAYETGYYHTWTTTTDNNTHHGYGKFNVILRKEEGRWKILLDADHGGITPEEFQQASPMETAFDPVKKQGIWVMDFLTVYPDKWAETVFYYENNWKIYREEALRNGYISDYKIIKVESDSLAGFNLVLLTEFPDSLTYRNMEPNFDQIIKSRRPNGPMMMNNSKSNDIRKLLYVASGPEISGYSSLSDSNSEKEKLIRKSIHAFSSNLVAGNFANLMAVYADDAKIFPPDIEIQNGVDAIRAYWSNGADKISYHKVNPAEIKILGSEAYDWGTYEGKSIAKDGTESSWKGKYTVIWKEVSPGIWKIYLDNWNRTL